MNILSKILYGKIDVFSHSGSLSTGEGGQRLYRGKARSIY